MGIFRKQDRISVSEREADCRCQAKVLELADMGYTQPIPRKDTRVQGKAGLAMFYMGAASMLRGQYIPEHDKKISEKLALDHVRWRSVVSTTGIRAIPAGFGT